MNNQKKNLRNDRNIENDRVVCEWAQWKKKNWETKRHILIESNSTMNEWIKCTDQLTLFKAIRIKTYFFFHIEYDEIHHEIYTHKNQFIFTRIFQTIYSIWFGENDGWVCKKKSKILQIVRMCSTDSIGLHQNHISISSLVSLPPK